jgi:hypothetical protein
MTHGILMHEPDDDVGVAVRDLRAGAEIGAITLEGKPVGTVNWSTTCPSGTRSPCATSRTERTSSSTAG